MIKPHVTCVTLASAPIRKISSGQPLLIADLPTAVVSHPKLDSEC